MIVTDLQYGLETKLVNKLDIMIERCTTNHPKRDALMINEGGEGEGKTNSSLAEAYYVKTKTDRDIYLFFRLQSLIDFAKSTENKILIWDEPSLDSLSTDHLKKINMDLTRLLMTVRKKRHFFIINMTKFYKFNEYIVVDRCLGMVNMYSRKGTEIGRFRYIKKSSLEYLFNAYRFSKKRLYFKLSKFGGKFPDIIEKYFGRMGIIVVDGFGKQHLNASYDVYEREKDKAIMSIGDKDVEKAKDKRDLRMFKWKVANIKFPCSTQKEWAEKVGISVSIVKSWLHFMDDEVQNDKDKATPQG